VKTKQVQTTVFAPLYSGKGRSRIALLNTGSTVSSSTVSLLAVRSVACNTVLVLRLVHMQVASPPQQYNLVGGRSIKVTSGSALSSHLKQTGLVSAIGRRNHCTATKPAPPSLNVMESVCNCMITLVSAHDVTR
jgi:hypothetical protein